MSNSTVTTDQTTAAQQTTTAIQTTPVATTPTTQNVVTSSVIAPSVPPTTQLVTSIITTSENGTPMPPSTVVVTKVTTPTPITPDQPTQPTSAAASASSTDSTVSSSPGKKGSSNSGLSTAGKTAIAVVIPVVVVALLVFAGLYLWRRRKQQKVAEEERRKEMEAYGFNPNNDPTLPAVGGVTDTEMGEDQSGYRGWGTTSSNRKASTTLASGMTQSHSDNGGYHSPGSPTQATVSDGHSADPLMHQRHSTMDSETIGALGAAPPAASNQSGVRRGPSNASSSYSMGDRSNHSGDAPIPVNQEYYTDNFAYGQTGPYDNAYGGHNQEAVIRDNPARRNTRIERPNVFPQQGSSGIAQNF